MALGDVNQNKTYSTTYYSRWSIKQKDGKLRLSASFSGGLLKLSVQQPTEGYHWDNIADISLSPTKASIFASELKKFIADFYGEGGWSGKSYGVDTGFKDTRPVIIATAINGEPYIIIGKVSPNGEFESRVDYSINQEYHYGLEWTDLDKMDVGREFYTMEELNQLIALCESYSTAAFGAIAASTLDMMKWDYSVTRNVDAIAEKLGVERRTRNDSSTGNSYFNKDHSSSTGSDSTPAKANRIDFSDLDV